MTEKKLIYQALADAKKEFHDLDIKKTGKNPHSKFSYFELADFIKEVVNCLHKHNLVSFTTFTEETANLKVVHTQSYEEIELTSPMSTAKLPACHEVQNLGAVETYIRRYLYMALMDIVEKDSLDSTQGSYNPQDYKKPKTIGAKGAKDLYIQSNNAGIPQDRLKKYFADTYGVDSAKNLTEANKQEIIALFPKFISKLKKEKEQAELESIITLDTERIWICGKCGTKKDMSWDINMQHPHSQRWELQHPSLTKIQEEETLCHKCLAEITGGNK